MRVAGAAGGTEDAEGDVEGNPLRNGMYSGGSKESLPCQGWSTANCYVIKRLEED